MTRPLDAILTAIHILKPDGTAQEKLAVARQLVSELENGNGNGFTWSKTARLRMAIAHLERLGPEVLDEAPTIAKAYKRTSEGKKWFDTVSDLRTRLAGEQFKSI
ncbi:MAG: hypothetical protein QXR38_02020 [Nitrososphaerales archaeon]